MSSDLEAVAYAVVKAWHALRIEEVRVHGPVEIVHSGRCGAQMNALLNAVENLALYSPPIGSGNPDASAERALDRAGAEREKNLEISSLTPLERSAMNEVTVCPVRIYEENDEELLSRSDHPSVSSDGDQRGDDSGS